MEVSQYVLWTRRYTYTFFIPEGGDNALIKLVARSHDATCQGYTQFMSRRDARWFCFRQLGDKDAVASFA